VNVGESVGLDGTSSSDPDGDDLTYQWTLSGPSGSDASLTDPSGTTPSFTPDETGVYSAVLEVSDGEATDRDTVDVRVENQAPTADAALASGVSTPVSVGESVELDGTGSSDPDGDDLTYSWTLSTPNNSDASLSDPSVAQPTFTPDVEGDYTATLEVSDGMASDSDDQTVTAETSTITLSSDITSDRTLTPDNRYVVTNTFCVANSATLTIEAGVEINFESNTALHVCDSAAIDANGTAENPVRMTATDGNEQPGWWKGVAIYSGNLNNSFEQVEVRYAGSKPLSVISVAANVAVDGGATLNITNSLLAQGDGYGLYLDDPDASLASFLDNTIVDNTDAPVWIPFTNIGNIDGDTDFGFGDIRVYGARLESGDVTIVEPCCGGDFPEADYRFSSRPVIDGASVTIRPGVDMTFESDVAFWVTSGSLVADGERLDPIFMTATDGNRQPGWWKGIAIYSSNANNTMDHVEIRHAGSKALSTISVPANIAVDGGATLNITNSDIEDGGGYGLYLDDSDASLANFSKNSFLGNADAPMWIPFTSIGKVTSAPEGITSFPEGDYVRVYGGTELTGGDVTINDLCCEANYRVSSRLEIDGASVTVEEGVNMTFESDVPFWVTSGSLIADGTANEPITMTATEGDEQQGWWRGVAIYSTNANNTMDYVEIRHAGSDALSTIDEAANIGIQEGGATLDLTNSTITDSGKHGVYCDDSNSSLTTSNNSYSNNAGQNVKGCP
jgi:hypothetical protein